MLELGGFRGLGGVWREARAVGHLLLEGVLPEHVDKLQGDKKSRCKNPPNVDKLQGDEKSGCKSLRVVCTYITLEDVRRSLLMSRKGSKAVGVNNPARWPSA